MTPTPGVRTILITDVTGSEGNSGVTGFVFEISLSSKPPVGSTVRVNYSTADITATDGSDYQAVSGVMTFSSETENLQRITVPVNGDTVFEPNESFFVKLTNLTVTGGGNVVLVKSDGIGVIFNDDPNPIGTPTPTPTPQGRLEGDVVDGNGSGTAGDGFVLANDVNVVRQMQLGLIPAPAAGGQFQAADVNLDANNGCGNGLIDAGDVTVIRRYNLGELALKTACGPTGPIASVVDAGEIASNSRVMRTVGGTSSAGRSVTVSFELDSQGDEASTSFTANWDPAVLRYEYPELGDDAVLGTNMGLNTSQTADGRLGVLLDSTSAQALGTRRVLRVRFTVADGVANGSYPITFSNTTTRSCVSNVDGVLLPTRYEPGFVTIADAAPGVTISGRVTNAVGQGVRGATVIVTDPSGIRRAATTGSFGFYMFENVEAGTSYVISVNSKRYRFAPQTLLITTNLTNIDFVGLE